MDQQPNQNLDPLGQKPPEEKNTPETPKTEKEGEKKKSKTGLVIALVILVVIALITVSIAGYFYYTWQNTEKESEEQAQEQKETEDEEEKEDSTKDDSEEEEDDATKDTDKDGLTDIKEKQLGTDPKKKDTDGDGYSDGDEVDDGYDPLTPATDSGDSSSTSSALIQPTDLTYQGTFRLPAGQGSDEEAESWGWGGYAMVFYPEGDPSGSDDGYSGSLYGSGHSAYSYISEISIPAPINSSSKNLSELTSAETLQGFTDMKGDYFKLFTELPRTGIAYLPKQGQQSSDKLYFAWGQHMQFPDTEEGDAPTHSWSELALDDPEIKGEWHLDAEMALSTNDYMFDIPKEWASKNTNGLMLATGRGQEGGVAGQGPSLYAIGPWKDGNPPNDNSKLTTETLLQYEDAGSTDAQADSSANAMKSYSHPDNWTGASWLSKGDKSAVAFVGTKAIGKTWYGYSDGTEFPTDGSEFTGETPDPPHNNRGWWADSFEAQIVFYNPDDLAKVAKGQMEAYEPQPYATLNIDNYLYNIDKVQDSSFPKERNLERVGAMSYDRENGIVYIFEIRGDSENERPLVHVFKVK